MLIGLCGPWCAGKTTIANYLVNEQGFILLPDTSNIPDPPAEPTASPNQPLAPDSKNVSHLHSNHHSTNAPSPSTSPAHLVFQCWKPHVNIVIASIRPFDEALPDLLKRPYFLLVHIDAPLSVRFERSLLYSNKYPQDFKLFTKFEDFRNYENYMPLVDQLQHIQVIDSDSDSQTPSTPLTQPKPHPSDKSNQYTMARLQALARLRLVNVAPTLPDLLESLRAVDFKNGNRLRPAWDSYFMKLAQLASERTNCMKRRVGCVITRNRRVVATGYNGTPSGVRNCNDGGCGRCNGFASRQGVGLDLCVCLHAEENAIIEAGRERCDGSTLYTNLSPCILCSRKIVQAGVVRVVFDKHYATGGASEQLLSAGGVIVDSFEADESQGLWEIFLTGR